MANTKDRSKDSSHNGSWNWISRAGFFLAIIPVLSAIIAYSWPLNKQKPLLIPDVQFLCAKKIYTASLDSPTAECFGYSQSSGLFIAVGTRESIIKTYKHAPIREMEGNVAILPGLYDSHGHIMHHGEMLENVNLFGANNYEEIIRRIRSWLEHNEDTIPDLKSGKKWLIGFGWDQNILPGGRYPTADDLDIPELSGIRVKFYRNDVHCVWVSNALLDLLRPLPSEIPGGEIIRDPGLGVLCDRASILVEKLSPPKTEEERISTFKSAMKNLNAVGLVGVHEASTFPETIRTYKKLAENGELSLRIYAMADCPPMNGFCRNQIPRLENYANGFLTVRSVKLFADGALGSWGAAMIEDYSDKPGSRGSMLLEYDQLEDLVRKWNDAGFQLNVHAIGDLANRYALNAFNAILPNTTTHVRNANHRFRIEHAQIIHPDDISLAQEMGIIMSMQPTHATTDMWYAVSRLGEHRLLSAYAQATFARNQNTTLILGSDFPVEPPSPIRGIYSAVNRLDPDTGTSPHGEIGWFPEQKLSFREALEGFTRHATYGAFQEDLGGTIEKGKWADWVVVEETGRGIERGEGFVRETWVGGKRVFG